jgi:hypothetical protein
MRRFAWILAAALVLAALPVAAQEEERGPITWLAYSKVKPGKTEDAVKLTLEDKAVMDGLIADGTIQSWGLVTPINHSPGDTWNFAEWVTLEDWSKVDDWVGAVMGAMRSMDPETAKSRMERAMEIYVEGSHFDEVVRHAVYKIGDAGTTRYFYVAEFAAKEGVEKEMVEFFKTVVAPALDPMLASGTMSAYGMYAPELHLDVDWTFRIWYALPNLASLDKMTQAFAGLMSPGTEAWAKSVFATHGHYDKVALVLYNSGAEAEGE